MRIYSFRELAAASGAPENTDTLLSFLAGKYLTGRLYEYGDSVPLHSDVLKSLCGLNYARNLEWLEANGALERDHSYSKGFYSKSCRLLWDPRKAVRVDTENPRLLKHLKKTEPFRFQQDGIRSLHWNCLQRFTIDRQAAIRSAMRHRDNEKWQLKQQQAEEFYAYLKTDPPAEEMLERFKADALEYADACRHLDEAYDNALDAIERIVERDWHLTKCAQGRIHTNLTNLPGYLKKHLRLDGEPVAVIDIVNSQPLVLMSLLQQMANSTDFIRDAKKLGKLLERANSTGKHTVGAFQLPELRKNCFEAAYDAIVAAADCRDEIEQWVKSCEDGQFYEQVADGSFISRKALKESVFKVMFGGINANSHFMKVLGPVAASIKHLKRVHYAGLAKLLQNHESTLIADGLARSLKIPFATVHDALIVKVSDIQTARTALLNAWGPITPSLAVSQPHTSTPYALPSDTDTTQSNRSESGLPVLPVSPKQVKGVNRTPAQASTLCVRGTRGWAVSSEEYPSKRDMGP